MKKIFSILVLATIMLAACTTDETQDLAVEIPGRITVVFEEDSRIQLNEELKTVWTKGDLVSVFYKSDANQQWKFEGDTGARMAVLTKVAESTSTKELARVVLLYPYSENYVIADDCRVTTTLHYTQNYLADSYGLDGNIMVSHGKGNNLQMKSVLGWLKLQLTGGGEVVESITIKGNNNEQLAGEIVIDPSDVSIQLNDPTSTTVTLDCGDGVTLGSEPTSFYIGLPPQTFECGFTIVVKCPNYREMELKTTNTIKIDRNTIQPMDVVTHNAEKVPRSNQIWYTSTDGNVVVPYNTDAFGVDIISNVYENGKGVITFSTDVASIGFNAFRECNITSIIMPDSITSIGYQAFFGCRNLVSVIIPHSVTSIKYSTFAECSSLMSVIIPDSVTTIEQYAFRDCSNLESITIPENITLIGYGAFRNCSALSSVYCKPIIPPTGSSGMFDNNATYRIIYVPASSVEAYKSAPRWSNYADVIVSDDISSIDPADCIITYTSSDENIITLSNPEAFGVYVVSNTYENGQGVIVFNHVLTKIGERAFDDCYTLTSVTIPDSVTSIGDYAFYGCSNLASITIPDCVTSIGNVAFGDCSSLKSIIIPDSVTAMGSAVFIGCLNLEAVTLSARLNSVGDQLIFKGCEQNLETIYMRAVLPPDIYWNDPNELGDFSKLTFYVPQMSLKWYKNSEWGLYWGENIESYDYGDLSEFFPNFYISTDYSADESTTILQSATVGNGIDIVLMGDGYSDRQIADGTYHNAMQSTYENLFTEEPYKSFKELFNVYYVTAVSATEGYEHGNTALSCCFGVGSTVSGNHDVVIDYALKAVEESRLDDTSIVVLMNVNNNAGTCYLYQPYNSNDYGSGLSVSYISVVRKDALLHEACGHGFAKLADEYVNSGSGVVPEEQVAIARTQQAWGWNKNIDFTSDPTKVLWAKFIADERYKYDGLGVFEGALYSTGVWRPTEDSIMRYNVGGFNAPSREAIYYRIHKLAYGDSWTYDYEKFVEWDAINRKSSAAQAASRPMVFKQYEPTAPPVVVGKSWREALGR